MRKKELSGTTILFEIESLGPIRDSIVEFKPFLLFTGESNTGKSYAAMAVYYLFFMLGNEKILSQLYSKFFDAQKLYEDLQADNEVELEYQIDLISEIERFYNDNINRFMRYMLGNDDFSCRVKLKLAIEEYTQYPILCSVSKAKSQDAYLSIEIPGSGSAGIKIQLAEFNHECLLNNISISPLFKGLSQGLVFRNGAIRNFFLPPARGAFTGLTPSMLKNFSGIGMYNEFLEGIDSVRFANYDPLEKTDKHKKHMDPLLTKLINGKIKVDRDSVSYTVSGSDEKIPLTASSSSIKELFPLALLLNRLPVEDLSICIEEPEAHLHPELQRITASLLAYIVNNGGLVQATTHSDFFINTLNNLIKLHYLKSKDQEKYLAALKHTDIREEFVLNPEHVGAYNFEKSEKGKTVHIKKLVPTENGMPMDSFKTTFAQTVEVTRDLREALSDDE